MNLVEINKPLIFDEDISLVHCVSRDLNMGAGIAVQFKKRYGNNYPNPEVGSLVYKQISSNKYIFNLVTKNYYYNKPTYDTLISSLLKLREIIVSNNIRHIAMPKIGCGLDKLEWNYVSQIIKEVFKDCQINIYVYYI